MNMFLKIKCTLSFIVRLILAVSLILLMSSSLSVRSEDDKLDGILSAYNDIDKLSIPVSNVSSLPKPKISSKSWIIVDVNSEQVLASSNPDLKVEPASLTKIMTAYLVFDAIEDKRLDKDQNVIVSEKAWRTVGSRMFLEPNKKVQIRDLLQGMIVQSGNDASIVLAESVSGDEDSFVYLMNREAKKIGMNSSNFTNVTGLPDSCHLTTARDLALLSINFLKKHESFLHYYKQKEFTYNGITQSNRNRLLWSDPSVDGLKTGHTDTAGYCLVSTALRGDRRILVVLLGANTEAIRTEESLRLLNWGFQNFDTIAMFEDKISKSLEARVWEGVSDKINLSPKNPLWLSVPRGRAGDVKLVVERIEPLIAPLHKDQIVGILQFSIDDQILKTVKLRIHGSMNRAGLFGRVKDMVRRWFEN
ncbi:D-alanyl-D-alanine carboxypeptidase family protein [Candidatus Kinetoplastidibacterium galati]|uniref:serine-type D-Ala-D-Ala carboxypeptidase n=1 Tax=Candidatus Kinetoplastidibacterium galati TCC219 TaxID=1208921 RepID=M1LV15_9PROT|nr:D-alanyl-D-alanine carboxypeptidase family protein [Candidatus Kinetoplastibacterium galatii]AGF49387.1 penicillin-binding D-alanyl-D-alanine carboxypeptidase [Candidatus Kinetoplastibacterium galatii TCC219]